MNDKQKDLQLIATFNTVSAGYDNPSLRFFAESARRMAADLGLRGDEYVLDVATGTGNAALEIARLLPRGKVLGLDFSEGMLEQARRKAAALKITNTEFAEMDMRLLELQQERFDAATCAFGIFFVDDMTTQLTRIAAAVKPGAPVALTGFRQDSFAPLSTLMFSHLARHGISKPPGGWNRIDTSEKYRRLFEAAGLTNIHTETWELGYFLDGPDQWWDVVWNAGFRGLVNRVAPEDQERFKEAHLDEVGKLAAAEGIWLDIGVLCTVGNKPW